MIGMDAERLMTKYEEPTMVLNLQCCPPDLQRSLVIHEFGHALGLEHVHQRSDFWDTVGECFDIEKMMKDHRVVKSLQSEDVKAGFERNWFKRNNPNFYLSEYDPDSIMHYLYVNKYEFQYLWYRTIIILYILMCPVVSGVVGMYWL